MPAIQETLDNFLHSQSSAFLTDWLNEALGPLQSGRTRDTGVQAEAAQLLSGLQRGLQARGEPTAFDAPAWDDIRESLTSLSLTRAAQGASVGDTSLFVLSMKKPLFAQLQSQYGNDADSLGRSIWWASTLVDKFAQHTISTYQRAREDIINRQQHELLELSTPVIKLWDGVLAVPMIGTLDSSRTQIVMEALLQRIVDSGSELAIIDITGVPTVDTLVAQHLLKTVTAIRLMGADCIISGIRPQIAQTIVHLGIDLQGVTTKATLADALALALKRTGHTISRVKA